MFLVTALVLSASACSSRASNTVERSKDVAARVLLPIEEENKLGLQIAQEIEAELTLNTDPQINQYVQQLGAQIARSAAKDTPEGITMTFKVVDDDATVNAFAIPGGGIYVYTGLLLAADNTAEIVGVLGHEAAHVTERHVAERLVASFGVQTLVNVALGRDPGTLRQIVGGLAAQGYLLKFGRTQEHESDRVAVDYVLSTSWDPSGLATFFDKLAKSPQPPTIVSTHPHPADRAKRVRGRVSEAERSAGTATGIPELDAIKIRVRSAASDPSRTAPTPTPPADTGSGTGTRTRAPQ